MVDDDEELLGEELDAPAAPLVLPLAEPEALPEVLGCAAELELESLLGEDALAPPEAEPDLLVSLEADPLIPVEELDEELGELGLVDEAPLDGDEGEVLGEVVELDEPLGVDEVLRLVSPRSQAARPKASATAAARMESFMCPPRLGY